MLGEHALPVRSEVAAPETRNTLFFSRAISLTASATAGVRHVDDHVDLVASNHCRAMFEPTSGLFWWSAKTISTFMPLAAAPKSSTAMRAATTEPGR